MELLTVIAIIGVLVALLLQAIQAAREAAWRTQCANNVKQIALACLRHQEAHRHFPTDGWGWTWVGDPDRGYGRSQTGGWLYNVLEFIEEPVVRRLGSDGKPDEITPAQLEGVAQLCGLPMPLLNCPSRGMPIVYPFGDGANAELRNVSRVLASPRTDYSANFGDTDPDYDGLGPVSLAQGLSGQGFDPRANRTTISGISFSPRSEIAAKDVTDGLSHTYLVGEGAMNASFYSFASYDPNKRKLPYNSGKLAAAFSPPMRDTLDKDPFNPIFGSAHSDGFRMAFCDGSVGTISYTINLETHRRLANRHDGLVIPTDN